VNFLDPAVEVAGRPVCTLAFPLVHVGPNHVAVGPMKFGVDVENALNVVVSRGNVLETAERETSRIPRSPPRICPGRSRFTFSPKQR